MLNKYKTKIKLIKKKLKLINKGYETNILKK